MRSRVKMTVRMTDEGLARETASAAKLTGFDASYSGNTVEVQFKAGEDSCRQLIGLLDRDPIGSFKEVSLALPGVGRDKARLTYLKNDQVPSMPLIFGLEGQLEKHEELLEDAAGALIAYVTESFGWQAA